MHMSLGDLISSCHKEIAGSRTKNRLTIQISYAIQLIMDFYSTDFLVMMDYIEDVSVISDPDNPSAIHLYQIKTKSTDRQYLLSAVIKDEWFQKLYRNALKYSDYVDSASLVCNTDIVVSGTEVFPNERTGLDDKSIEENIKKIRKATYVKSKATNQLLKEYWDQISYNSSEIDRLRKDSAEINQRLSAYTQEKEQANTVYQGNLTRLLAGLDIPSDQVETESEPGTHLSASGAYGPRCKIAQMLAFVETQHSTAPDLITFPMVIDSPNVLEQDDEHLESIIRTLLTWDKTCNQIIVASIQGRNMASTIDDVKIITLDNPQNHLFDSAEYAEYEAEIAEIFTQF